MASDLLLDSNKGMLEMMTESTYPGQRGSHPATGEEVLDLARQLKALC